LSGVDANLFFLFKVKCPVIARHAGLALGLHVLRSGNDVAPPHAQNAGKPALVAV
jgi:hypothetical protein